MGRGNFVTAADKASEQEILRLLEEAFPRDQVLTEESPAAVGQPADVPLLWVIAPLDGTNSFRFGRPYAAVSVAYVEGGVPGAGAVCDPLHGEPFFAAREEGAFLNGRAIRVGNVRHLPSASVGTDNGCDPVGTKRNLELCLRIHPDPWILVRGSAVLRCVKSPAAGPIRTSTRPCRLGTTPTLSLLSGRRGDEWLALTELT